MSFLTRLHADLRMTRLTKRGATHRPEDVPTGTHKTYERMRRIALPEPNLPDVSLQDALTRRRSGIAGNADAPISLDEFGTLLGLALRRRPNMTNRNYPSGGGLYPVETYLLATTLEGETPAAFHYNPTEHALERLWDLPERFSMKDVAKHPPELELSALVVFTSVWERSSAKYGDLAYQHALIEAGHMSENVLLIGTALELSVRPYAGFNDTLITQLLDLNDEEEQAVHAVTICKRS